MWSQPEPVGQMISFFEIVYQLIKQIICSHNHYILNNVNSWILVFLLIYEIVIYSYHLNISAL